MRNLLSVAKPEIKPDKPTEEKGYTWTCPQPGLRSGRNGRGVQRSYDRPGDR